MATAIITGGSSGLGAALGRELHRRGWSVGLVARRRELLEELAAELGANVAIGVADVTDLEALRAAISGIEAQLGVTDLLVANAGVGGGTPITRLRFDRVRQLMEINVTGVINAVECVLPGMLERGRGHLAAMSSLAGGRGLPPATDYSASKAAVDKLFEGWRNELAAAGVAVTTIQPGFVDTPFLERAKHPTPLLMPVDQAARRIADGLQRKQRLIRFPLPTSVAMRVAEAMPDALFDALVRRFVVGLTGPR